MVAPMAKTLKRSPLKDRWRRWKASGIPWSVRMAWALEDASLTHPVLMVALLAIMAAAVGWIVVSVLMAIRHP